MVGDARENRTPSMTFLQAAEAVLRGAGKPLTAREILEDALRRGYIRPTGKTPEATLSADLYLHARDAAAPRIVREFTPGATRARRGSVRWRLAG
jgi:hypothetical protein